MLVSCISLLQSLNYMLTVSGNLLASANDFSRYKVGEYVYGHHKSKASFLASIRKGCAMCNRFSLLRSDGNNSRLKSLGYFSVFYVSLDQERSVDRHFMIVVQVENIQGRFDLVPLGGKTCIATTSFTLVLSSLGTHELTIPSAYARPER